MRSSLNVVTSVALAASAALLVPTGLAMATTEPPTEPAPESTAPAEAPAPATESAHSQVIAQGVIDFPAGQFAWTPSQEQIDAATEVDPQGSQFLLAETGALVVSNGIGQALLASGEAVFDPRSLPAALSPVGGAPAGYWSILLTSGSFEASDTTIEPGAGARDVNLVRDVLAAGESLSVPSELPQFVLVTAGAVTTSDGITVDAGASTTVVGGAALTNSGTGPATVVLAVIGDLLEPATESPATTVAPSTTAPGTTAPASTSTVPNNTEPVAPADLDADGDGLSDEDEIVIGTDRFNPDTDGDGLSDYEEASDAFNSDPTAADTDGDGLDDGEEAALGTDAGAIDTDGDGVDDWAEVTNGTDPLDPTSFSAG